MPDRASSLTRPMVEAPLKFRLRSGGNRGASGCFVHCPKCDAPAFIRRSDRPSPTVAQLWVHCSDSACGHTWRADIVFVHTLSPGTIERPDLDLPVCPKSELVHVRPPSRDGPEGQDTLFD
ncbi:MAG: ogr/Delta-like zinc finger family protein [Porphyrobacter sp.]|nr:ogr/Delta-like zinc finger family protein [Porphyrobacter sp.]